MVHPSWRDQALCRTDPDLPWIAEPSVVSLDELIVMEAVRGACMVCFECLEDAGCHDVTAGFWAGAFRRAELTQDGEVG